METSNENETIWTWESADGKSMHAGFGMKPGAGKHLQPYRAEDGTFTSFTLAALGGLSGGNEVRGKVHGPGAQQKHTPAEVIWKHPKEQHGLESQMRDVVEGIRSVPELESVFISSGHRAPLIDGDPHAEGRAVDVSRINGIHVQDLKTALGPEAEKAKRAAANLETQLMKNPDVNQIIGPNGGWNREGRGWKPIQDTGLLEKHTDHFHINVFRK